MAESQVTEEELRNELAEAPPLRHYGVLVADGTHGGCELLIPFNESVERPDGIISGMAIMGAADVALRLAIMTMRGLDERWVRSDMQTVFLRSGRAESMQCTARVLRRGRRSAFGTAECRGVNLGHLLAHHSLRYAKVMGEERG
jgi:acyl-coenzyme A thioesterase PaaI-like protein